MTETVTIPASTGPWLRVGRTAYPVVLPRPSDARLHVAAVIVSLHVLGQVVLGFRVSVPQILAAILSCALVEVLISFRRSRTIVWPASAMLTGSGIGLILRDASTEAGDHWTFRNWWLFAGIALFSLGTKYVIRWRDTHVFNPSNLGLVVAFLVLGSDRIEPLDFWWGPFSVWMLLAYWLIIAGGVMVADRLDLLELAAAFWLAFVVVMGSLSASGHCITAPWSIGPVCDTRFWWIIVTSPELLVFLFFMITDPRTVPSSRNGRVAFGVAVALTSSLLIAPQTTEFGAKVGLLGGLVIVCAARPLVSALWSHRSEQSSSALFSGRHRLASSVTYVGLAGMSLLGVAAAGHWSRSAGPTAIIQASVDPRTIVTDIDPVRIPAIGATPEVADFIEDSNATGIRLVAIELIRALDVEALALERRDPEALLSVDHGTRLIEMQDRLRHGPGVIEVDHRFDRLDFSVVRSPGQGGLRLAAEGEGMLAEAVIDDAGNLIEQGRQHFARQFVMRAGVDGRWFVVSVRDVAER